MTKQYVKAYEELPREGENQTMCFAYMMLHRKAIKRALELAIERADTDVGAWRDISTAPKGQWCIIYGEAENETHDRDNKVVTAIAFNDSDEEMQDLWHDGGCHFYPTHWQPLPTPPKESE